MDHLGNVLWQKALVSRDPTQQVKAFTVVPTGAAGSVEVFIMGETDATVSSYTGIFIMRMGTDGTVKWQNALTGAAASLYMDYGERNEGVGRMLAISPDGEHFAVAGYADFTPTDEDSGNYQAFTAQLPSDEIGRAHV